MTSRWGVPDWLDADAYPKEKSTSLSRWWWEFTRRRPDYRTAWENARDQSSDGYRMADDPAGLYLKFNMSGLFDPSKCPGDELALSSWRLGANFSTRAISHPRAQTLEKAKWLAEKFGTSAISDELQKEQDLAKRAEEHGIALYQFDLSRPLPEQLARAAELPECAQEYRFKSKLNSWKRQRGKWPLYLRCLDADDAGASLKQMAVTFWPKLEPNPHKARDARDAARHLRDNFPI
jgi:hypothetical protein